MPLADTLGRPLGNLRLSVTDRCNLRCAYCMPEQNYSWLPHKDILRFEEISGLVDVFIALGVPKFRLTGGEPLLRRDLSALVRMLAAKPGVADLAMTTNGLSLAEHADALRAAGLGRITVSLDTLHTKRFAELTRVDAFDAVLDGMNAASRAFGRFKIDSVIVRGVNDDELPDLIEYGRSKDAEVRFIEYMDVGGATRWSPSDVVSRSEMLDRLAARYGPIEPLLEVSATPADRFRLPDGLVFGIISSTTAPFCGSCDRSRLTADGMWYLCLYASRGVDLRTAMRDGATPEELSALITNRWQARTDRGAEDRLALGERRAFIPVAEVRKDPHFEMHTRGG
jgi:GTP 3',8-cyclase